MQTLALRLDPVALVFHGKLDRGPEVEGFTSQADQSALDPRHIEEIVKDSSEVVRLPPNQKAGPGGHDPVMAHLLEHRDRVDDHVHGVPQFVRRMARTSSLARLALSASVRARCSAASRSTCSRASVSAARFCSVMSRAIFEAPMTFPEAFLMGETVSEMVMSSPFLRRRTVS
jgi:hypothetical protein